VASGYTRGLLENQIAAHLPTPVVNDMGANKTVEWWDDWVAEKKAQHGNGNGHGNSLAIEVRRLLGDATPPPSDDGSPSLGQPPAP